MKPRTPPGPSSPQVRAVRTGPSLGEEVSPPGLDRSSPLDRGILALALLCGIAFMVPVMRAGPLALDEHGTYWLAGPSNPSTLVVRSLNYENIPPLAPLIQRGFLQVFGESEFVFRLPGILCFWGAIVAAYWLGRDLHSPLMGSLTALILACRPFVVGEVRLARVYGLSLFLATLAFWLVVRWLREPAARRWGLLWGGCAVGLMWTHYLNAFVVIVQFLTLLPLTYRGTWGARWFFACSCIVAVGGAPLLPSVLRMTEDGQYFGFQSDLPFWRDISHLWWAGLPAGWVAARILNGFPRRAAPPSPSARWVARFPPVPLWVWGLLPVLLVPIVCQGSLASLANPRYRIGFAAPAACFAAWILAKNVRPLAAIGGCLLLVTVTASLADAPPWRLKRLGTVAAREWRTIAEIVRDQGTAGEPLFVQSGLGEGFLIPRDYRDPLMHDYTASRLGRFYLKRPHPRYALPFFWGRNPGLVRFFEERLRELRENGSAAPTFWVAVATDTDLNVSSRNAFQQLVRNAGGRAIDRREFRYSELIHYTLSPASPSE